uniref:Uncharacterized protein n=1 Tax=Daucus carota subsp. sativus TaxID=79200 RepID=A0A162AI96_DAUCS
MDGSESARKRATQGPHSPSSTNKGAKRRAPVHDSGVGNNENSNPNIISAPSIDSGAFCYAVAGLCVWYIMLVSYSKHIFLF